MPDKRISSPISVVVLGFTAVLILFLGILTWQVLSPLQQPAVDQVASIRPSPPPDLRVGKNPIGGPTESPTGGGAGGAGAAGYEAGRVSGSLPQPTTPPYSYSLTESRMSPIASDGSSIADRGHPLAPDQPLVPANANGVTQQFTPAPGQVPVNVDTHSISSAPMKR